MSVTNFLRKVADDFVNFKEPAGYEGRIIHVSNSGSAEEEWLCFKKDFLDDWLNKVPKQGCARPASLRGSLYLLVHRWNTTKGFDASLPFEKQAKLDQMLKGLGLPRSFSYDFGRRQHIPARMFVFEDGIDIICQTPKFPGSFVSMALSYNSNNRTTTGFLAVTEGEMSEVFDVLDALRPLASHPLLLPISLYWVCSQILRRDMREVHNQMDKVQTDTGLLKSYLRADRTELSIATVQAEASGIQVPTHAEIHRNIVEQHALLTRGLSEFTDELGQSCRSALEQLDQLGSSKRPLLDERAHLELDRLLRHTETCTKYELQHRERMLSRVNIQLQVLYNLMQSRIGDETLRDSSAMKSIALLTMIFLPSTALATIFSMSSFFSQTSDNTHLMVSSEFWIFWAIALPITGFVVATYLVWIQRAEIRRWWVQRRQQCGNNNRDIEAAETKKDDR